MKTILHPGERALITEWFVRAIGAVWFINFTDLNRQLNGLFGSKGLIPVSDFTQSIWANTETPLIEKLVDCPSLFLFFPQDGAMRLLAVAGLLLAVSVMAGYRSRLCFALLFVIYASFVNTGQALYSFQWDALILETTFLAILLPDSGKFFSRSQGASKVASWLFLWLLFRLYIESGVAKLFWGPESWATLKAMSHYYETAPIPTPLAHAAHFLPEWWHRFETGATLAIEILIPGFIMGGRWMRRAAFIIFTLFQIAIIATANYGIFNYTTLCLHLFLLKDDDIRSLCRMIPALQKRISFANAGDASASKRMYFLAAVIVAFSVIEFMMLAGGRGIHQTVVGKIQRYTGATRIASRYHLFGPIDPIRYELVIEGTADGGNWLEYQFRYKADDLFKSPRFIAPFHPRVDFRLWFERYPVRWENTPFPFPEISAHPSTLPNYLGNLLAQCFENPEEAERHFLMMPLDQSRPVELRVAYYHYQMAEDKFVDGKKQFWTRTLAGYVYIDPLLTDGGRPAVARGRTTQVSK